MDEFSLHDTHWYSDPGQKWGGGPIEVGEVCSCCDDQIFGNEPEDTHNDGDVLCKTCYRLRYPWCSECHDSDVLVEGKTICHECDKGEE